MSGENFHSRRRNHTREIQYLANFPGADIPNDIVNVRIQDSADIESLFEALTQAVEDSSDIESLKSAVAKESTLSSIESSVATESTLSSLLSRLLDSNDEVSLNDSTGINVQTQSGEVVDSHTVEIGPDDITALSGGTVTDAIQAVAKLPSDGNGVTVDGTKGVSEVNAINESFSSVNTGDTETTQPIVSPRASELLVYAQSTVSFDVVVESGVGTYDDPSNIGGNSLTDFSSVSTTAVSSLTKINETGLSERAYRVKVTNTGSSAGNIVLKGELYE